MMYRLLLRNTGMICGAVIVPNSSDILTKKLDEDFKVKWERVKKVFYISEFGEMTPQLNTMIQTTLLTSFFGCFYGGFISAREEYFKFIERNEATKFSDHFEAKKKLQQSVTLGFGKGAIRWGWRLGMFGGFYISYIILVSVYRGSSSVIDYSLAGVFSGSIYRLHMGVKAMIAGGTLGGMMGLFAGCLTTFLFRFTGSSLDDIHHQGSEITAMRNRHVAESIKKSKREQSGIKQDEITKTLDAKHKTTNTLDD